MKRSLAIENHVGFQWTVLRCVAAGGLLGAVHSAWAGSAAVLGEPTGMPGAWSFAYGGLAVLLLGGAAVLPSSRRRAVALSGLALGGALVSGLVARCAVSTGCSLSGAIGLGLCVGLYLALGLTARWQAALALVAGTAAVAAAQQIPRALGAQDFLLELPGAATPVLSGMALGLVAGSAAITRYLKVHLEPMDKELRALLPPPSAEDEISKLVTQAAASYQQAAECLEEHPQARTAAELLVKKIARFGKKWQDIEAQSRRSDKGQLEQRLTELTARRDAATDESVRSEYERATSALREQLSYLGEIEKGRERAVARLHHQVATLDRLRLAALRHRSVGASKLGEELRGVVDELTQAGQELDTASEVLAELPA
ncbi:MAG: hypothetical protein U1A78_21395 [Polyangia bacterium]